MAKFITAKEAAQLIPDHATVGVAGMGLSGWPEEIACAIRDNFAETGHPCDLNLKQASALMGQKSAAGGRYRSRKPRCYPFW